MRGLAVVMMLFLNDLSLPEIPTWIGSLNNFTGGGGLTSLLFSGFLFIAGMVIPPATGKRISEGQATYTIGRHIVIRSVSLLIMGILIINVDRVNPEFTGFGKNLWAVLMYTGIFLVWNRYVENDRNFFSVAGLRLAGMAILVALVFKFRSGEFVNNGSLITGWWGYLGQIGWGYLISAAIYLVVRNRILNIAVALLFFVALNIITNIDLLDALDPVKAYLDVIVNGYVPFTVLSGVLTALIMKKQAESDSPGSIVTIVIIGSLEIIAGLILRRWVITPDVPVNAGQMLSGSGIFMIIYSLLYLAFDIKRYKGWTSFIRVAGEYSLTIVLASQMISTLILISGIPLFFYKQSAVLIIPVAGSLAWAFLMVVLTKLLVKYGIMLKL